MEIKVCNKEDFICKNCGEYRELSTYQISTDDLKIGVIISEANCDEIENAFEEVKRWAKGIPLDYQIVLAVYMLNKWEYQSCISSITEIQI